MILDVAGMSCNHCKARVEKALNSVEGVNNVEVDLENGKAKVEGPSLDVKALAKAVTNAGYAVTGIE